MKVKLHRDRIEEIICEELDRLETIYEKVAGSSRRYSRLNVVQTNLAGDSDFDECDIDKPLQHVAALHPSIRDEFQNIYSQIQALTKRPEFKGLKGKIKLGTYKPYKGSGPFNLINAVNPDDNCPGSYACHVAVGAGDRLNNEEIAFYQAVHKIVKSGKKWKMKEELPPNASVDDALSAVSSTTDIQLMIALDHPSVQDMLATWELVKQGKEPCPGVAGADDSGTVDALLGGGGESEASDSLEATPSDEPCPEPPAPEPEEEPEEVVPEPPPPPDYKSMAQNISAEIEAWWKNYGGFFQEFKGTFNDDEAAGFSKYQSDVWPSAAVSELDDTHRSILNQVLDDIEEQITDTIINDVEWHVGGTKYKIDDNDLDF